MQKQKEINLSYTLINSTNNKNKKIFLKKNFLFNILFIFCFLNLTHGFGQDIDSNGVNIFYYSNGVKSSEGFFKNGLPDSLWKTYNLNGVLISQGYKKKGQSDSLWLFYTDAGLLKQQSFYKHNMKNGCTILYDTAGLKIEERFYIDDTIQNEVSTFYPTGELKTVTNFKDGKKHEEAIEYSQTGEIALEAFYENGNLVDSKSINRYNENQKKKAIGANIILMAN